MGELAPDETVDAMREAKLLSTVCCNWLFFEEALLNWNKLKSGIKK